MTRLLRRLLALLLLASPRLVAQAPTRVNASTLLIGFATADFKTAKAAGFDFAEVRIREFMKLSEDDFDKYAADCRATGLPLTTGYWLLPADLKVVGPDVRMDQVTTYLLKALDRSRGLGVKFVVWGSGDARRAPDGFSKAKAFDQLVALGKWLAPEAQKRGIVIVAEPLRRQESNTINSAAEGLQWVEAVDHRNFQLLVDLFHMYEEKEDVAIIVKAGAHIVHTHVSNPIGRVLPMSAEEFDYGPYFEALNQIGFHGTMTIETTAVDIPRDGPKSIRFLRAAFQLAASSNGRAGNTTVSPPKVETTITVDGRLDEPVWSRAARLTGFSLYTPVDGRPAPDSTEVLVWYSSDAIHFGIKAFADSGTVAATLADRDRITSDDNVEIHLDTFHERNRAFVFIVNPLGVQADGTKSEGGGFIPGSNVGPGQNDLSADFVWQSRGVLTPYGYDVEVRIPFSSLRYPSADVQQWGLQIDRHVQRNGYEETWTPARRASASFIAQSGTLDGLTGMRHGQVVELNPEFTNTTRGSACCAPALQGWSYDSHPQLGGNIRWAMGSNFVLNGTIKPDFSQVEADATQVAADARFALFYPERRPFFVEALDQFNVPNQLVYTRTIVQPDGAAKLTGKVGTLDVAALSALDQGGLTPNGDKPRVDIVRLRQRLGEQSQAGLVFSDRVGGGRANRVVGADTKIVFGGIYFAQFQAVQTFTTLNNTSTSGAMWEAVVDATNRGWGFHYNVLGIQPDFRADNGFVPRTGFVKPSASNRFTWYGKPGALAERYNIFATVNALWRYDDFFSARSLLEDAASAQMQVTLRGGWSVGLTPRLASFAFDPSDYKSYSNFTPSPRITTLLSGVSIATPQFRTFAASAGTTVGNDVDFLETSRVRRIDYNAALDLRPSDRLRVGATYVSTSFARRATGEQSAFARIPRIKVEYQLARPLFVRVVSQYTATRREALVDPRTGAPIVLGSNVSTASASNTLRTDWLLSYRPTPGTVFFLGYGGSLSEEDPLAFARLRRTADALFVKASYVLRN